MLEWRREGNEWELCEDGKPTGIIIEKAIMGDAVNNKIKYRVSRRDSQFAKLFPLLRLAQDEGEKWHSEEPEHSTLYTLPPQAPPVPPPVPPPGWRRELRWYGKAMGCIVVGVGIVAIVLFVLTIP